MTSSARHHCPIPILSILLAYAAFITLATPSAQSLTPEPAQGIAPDSITSPARLLVTSEPAGAAVYADSVLLGTTPLNTIVPPGDARRPRTVRLKIVGGDPGSWFVPVLLDSVILTGLTADGGHPDSFVRRYSLPLTVRVASDPGGAEILLGDSLIGTTPLFASLPGTPAVLTLRKEGYQSSAIILDASTRNYRVQLQPVDEAGTPKPVYLADGNGQSMLPTFLAAGAAVASGAAAAYFKARADRTYALYRITGDATTLDQVRRNDLLSGIALAIAEISIGYLVIELLSR